MPYQCFLVAHLTPPLHSLPSSLNPSPSLPRWFSIVLYLTFLFTVIVVLLNLLIAQMSDTYTKVQDDVEGTFAIARARIIARLQKDKWLYCKEVGGLSGKGRANSASHVYHVFSLQTYWKKYYSKYLWIGELYTHPSVMLAAHHVPLIPCAFLLLAGCYPLLFPPSCFSFTELSEEEQKQQQRADEQDERLM